MGKGYTMRQIFGFIVFLDGFLSAVLGHTFILFLRFENAPPWIKSILDYFLTWDERNFRIGASFQALVGLLMMGERKK